MKLKNLFLSTLAIAAFAGTTYSVTNIDQYLTTTENSIYDDIDTVQGHKIYTNENLTLTLQQETSTVPGQDAYVDVYGIKLDLYLSSYVGGVQSSTTYSINASLDFTNAKYDFDTNGGGTISGDTEIGLKYEYYNGNEDSYLLQYTPTSTVIEYYEDSYISAFTSTDDVVFTSTLLVPSTIQAADIQIVNDINGADYLSDGKTKVQDSYTLYSPDYFYTHIGTQFYYDNMKISYTGTTLEISYNIVNNGFDTTNYIVDASELNVSGYLILPFKTIDDPTSDDPTDVINAVDNTAFETRTELLMNIKTSDRDIMTQTVDADGNYKITYSIDLATSSKTFDFYAMTNTSTNYYSYIESSTVNDDDEPGTGTTNGIDFTNSWETMTFIQMMGSLQNTTATWWQTGSLANGDITDFNTFFDISKAKFVPQIEVKATETTSYTYTIMSKEQYDSMTQYSNDEAQKILTYGAWIAIAVSITAFVMGLVAIEATRQLKDRKPKTDKQQTK